MAIDAGRRPPALAPVFGNPMVETAAGHEPFRQMHRRNAQRRGRAVAGPGDGVTVEARATG